MLKKILKEMHLYCVLKLLKSRIEYLFPAKVQVKRELRRKFNEELNLEDPKTYHDKLQWLKLYGRDKLLQDVVSLMKQCSDKLEVRKYVKSKIGGNYLNELYGVYKSIKEIDFSKLPEEFVIKATHDSGSVYIKRKGEKLDFRKLRIIECNLK